MTAAQEGSFSRAAEALGITHGAVSRRIAAVEAWAGYRLFDRHGRGVRLTVAGYALSQQIERAVALLDDSRRIRGTYAGLPAVRVGVVPSFARMWLFPNLSRLEGAPPDLRIEADVDDRFMALSESRLAIRYGTGAWPGVTSRPLFAEWSLPVASRSIAQQVAGDAREQRLLDWPILHDTSATDWTAWFSRCGVFYEAREQDRVFPAYDLVLIAASQGLGIALLRDPYGTQLVNALNLVALSTRRVPLPNCFHVLTSAHNTTDAAQRLAARLLDLMGRNEI